MANDTISGDRRNDTLNGLAGNDILDGGLDNDTLNGGDGNDVLIGGTGSDRMTGGAGADIFRYTTTTESGTTTATRDTITDFAVGVDVIDVQAIDANTGLAGNQAFTFIGTAVFSGLGQARYVGGILEFNSTGNNNADMTIALTGSPTITALNGAVIW